MLEMKDKPTATLKRKLLLAKGAIAFEGLWVALFPALMVAGLALLLVLAGVPALLSAPVKIAAAAVFGIAFVVALWPLRLLSWPDDTAALRRIEVRSGLKNRPATTWQDKLAEPQADPASRAIWMVHKRRMAEYLKSLKAGWPRSGLPVRDPIALRSALVLGLVVAGFLNWGQWDRRLSEAVSAPVKTVAAAGFDAWITPPAYTGKPPVLLSGAAAKARLEKTKEILVPQGSLLVVRLNGASQPVLKLTDPDQEDVTEEDIRTETIPQASDSAVHEARKKLNEPVQVSLVDQGRTLADWRIAVIPDAPPTAEVTAELALTPTGGFAVPWKASDDYGIAGLEAHFRLAGDGTGEMFADALKYDPPQSAISLQKLNPREADGRAFMDFTAHPWAGASVELQIEVRDQSGQIGRSAPVRLTLPERKFSKLLARAVVEQRRHLVLRPIDKPTVVRTLAALMAWPDELFNKSAHYLGLRMAASRLYRAKTDDEIKEVVELLWELAVSIEDGDLTGALKELEALRKELQKAIAEGASQERIAELMNKMRQAMNQMLETMAREMQQALKNGEQMQQQQVDPEQMIRSQDLQKMLDMIENLAKQGAKDAAQEMLAQLENLLKNLRPGVARQGDQQNGSQMSQMLQQLGEMMQRQQQLMDKTFQLPEGFNGQSQDMPQGNQRSDRGQQNMQPSDSLSDQQDALGRMLDELMEQLNQQGMNAPGGMDRSKGAMKGAADALREGEKGEALSQQGEAMEGLRESARSMAQQMQQQGNGNEGNFGRTGEARGNRDDPLGRPMPRTGEDFGPERNMLPGQAAIERARQI
ncbi:MAG: TIGR02302 family protein, partial [Rhizobiales bacterium]|nr:TIGR02302 family protein [Hyphomicrobiales bacterium]